MKKSKPAACSRGKESSCVLFWGGVMSTLMPNMDDHRAILKALSAERKRIQRQKTEAIKANLLMAINNLAGEEEDPKLWPEAKKSKKTNTKTGRKRKHIDMEELLQSCINAVKHVISRAESSARESGCKSPEVPPQEKRQELDTSLLRSGIFNSQTFAAMVVRTHDMVVLESSTALQTFAPRSYIQSGYKGQSLFHITSPEDVKGIEMLQKMSKRSKDDVGSIETSIILRLLRITPDKHSDNLLYTYSRQNVQIGYGEENGTTLLLTFIPREEDLEQLQTTDEFWKNFDKLRIEAGQDVEFLREDLLNGYGDDGILDSRGVSRPANSDPGLLPSFSLAQALVQFLRTIEVLDIKSFVAWQRDEAKNNRVTMLANAFMSKFEDGSGLTRANIDTVGFLNFGRDNEYDFERKTSGEGAINRGMILRNALKVTQEGEDADMLQQSFLFNQSQTGDWTILGGISLSIIPDGHMIRHVFPSHFSFKPSILCFTRRGQHVLSHEEQHTIRGILKGLSSNEQLVKSQYVMFNFRDINTNMKDELAKIDSVNSEIPYPISGSDAVLSSKSLSTESPVISSFFRSGSISPCAPEDLA